MTDARQYPLLDQYIYRLLPCLNHTTTLDKSAICNKLLEAPKMPGSSEYTPLLSDPSAEQLGESQRTTTTTVLSDQNLQPCTPFLRTTVIMTWISVVSSVLALCLSLTIAFMDWYTSPSSYNGWLLLDCTQQMIMLVCDSIRWDDRGIEIETERYV